MLTTLICLKKLKEYATPSVFPKFVQNKINNEVVADPTLLLLNKFTAN